MKKLSYLFVFLFLFVGVKNADAQNNCLDFDGTNDYAATVNTINLNTTNSITLEAWVYINSFAAGTNDITSIIGIENGSNGTALLRFGDPAIPLANNKLQFILSFSSSGTVTQYKLNGVTALSTNTWYHVAATFETGTIYARIYINGVEDAVTFLGNETNFVANDKFFIGAINSTTPERFINGKIDEVRVWSTARTVTDIRNAMYDELLGSETGLVLYYKLDEASGTTADNAEGTVTYDATLYNMTNSDWVTSPAFAGPKNCLNLNGGLQASTADYAYKTSNVTSNIDNFTMMAWFKATTIPSGDVWRCIAFNGDDAGGYGIGIRNSKVAGLFGTTLWATTNESVTAGKWYHIAMRRSSGTVKFFLNGKLLPYSDITAPITVSDNFTIGNMFQNNGTSIYVDSFDGQIDEVRVYDAALTDQQIREAMCNAIDGDELNLVAYYNFDNTAGTKLQSFDGGTTTGNDLTLVNTTNTNWVGSSAFNTWLNVTNTAWETTTNWSRETVPTTTDNVGITTYTGGSYPTCNGTAVSPSLCDNLSIATGTTLDVTVGKALTVSGNLFNYGTTTINSDATGTGSLIVNGTATGDVKMERYIASATWVTWNDGWHFLSSPVANYAIQDNFTVATATDYDFYAWSESNNLWINFKNTSSTPTFLEVNGSNNFELGHGYMAAYKTASTKNFTGSINVSDVTITGLTNTGGIQDYHSWHLLGNPFNSALTWDNTWTTTNIGANIQIWNEAGTSYTVIPNNPGGVIPATNGFMIQGTDATTASVTIPKSKRVHSTQAFYKSVDFPIIKLKANNIDNPSFQESQLLFNPESTLDYEPEYDCDFLAGYAPLFYSKIDNRPVALNNMPNVEETTNIPFTFVKNEGLNFSIEMYEMQNMDMDVWLYDNKLNKDHNLTLNPVYVFTAFENDNSERFTIHFSPLGLEEETIVNNNIQVYTNNKTLYILNPEMEPGTVAIYSLTGQKVDEFVLTGDTKQQQTIVTGNMINIIRIQTKDEIISQKVIFK